MNPSSHCHQHHNSTALLTAFLLRRSLHRRQHTDSCNHCRSPTLAAALSSAQLYSPPLLHTHCCTAASIAALTAATPYSPLYCRKYSCTYRCFPILIAILLPAHLQLPPFPGTHRCTVVNTLAAAPTAALSLAQLYLPPHCLNTAALTTALFWQSCAYCHCKNRVY